MLLEAYRTLRVIGRQALGDEPVVRLDARMPLEFLGNGYCGWAIPLGILGSDSGVVDVGLGEDVSFTQDLIARYGCVVHGFDPTPRALHYVGALNEPKLVVHEAAVAGRGGTATFYLPNDSAHVSGSLAKAPHVGQRALEVRLVTLADVMSLIGRDRIDLLKVDIEGAEYDLIADTAFAEHAQRISCLCIEFHHRWANVGKHATLDAVRRLHECGFACVWKSRTTNEEFTFLNLRRFGRPR
jgi:FkbM family methyltransferase